MSAQQDVVRFLALLDNAPKSRRTWLVLQGHCRYCGDRAIEVYRTPVAGAPLVAVHTGMKRGPGTSILGLGDKGLRADAPTISVLLSANQDGLHVACKCSKRVVTAATLLDAVHDGRRELVLTDTPG